MKHTILDLKKKVLVVEVPEKATLVATDEKISVFQNEECIFQIEGNFQFICKGSEITEEIASGIVEVKRISSGVGIIYHDYKNKEKWLYGKQYATSSFKSAIESKGLHWLENPTQKQYFNPEEFIQEQYDEFLEAEEKTFRNCLLFEICQ